MEWSELPQAFFALAHPARIQVLRILIESSEGRNAGTLSKLLNIKQSTLSSHLATLLDVDLVFASRNGRHIVYFVNTAKLKTLAESLQRFSNSN
jgi:DNA-binding transcriptional ArsR family regulator